LRQLTTTLLAALVAGTGAISGCGGDQDRRETDVESATRPPATVPQVVAGTRFELRRLSLLLEGLRSFDGQARRSLLLELRSIERSTTSLANQAAALPARGRARASLTMANRTVGRTAARLRVIVRLAATGRKREAVSKAREAARDLRRAGARLRRGLVGP
jgi:hypothetical protein